MDKLLKVRKEKKSKKPDFKRQDCHKKPKLSRSGWRKPKGQDSKMRVSLRGYRRSVSSGFRSPSAVRGLDVSGLKQVLVSSLKQLEKLDPKTDGVVLSSGLGFRKREVLIKKCSELKLKILNIKNPEEYIKSKQSAMEALKKEKEKSKQQKESKKKAEEKETKKAEEKKAEKKTEEKAKDQKASSQDVDGKAKEKKELDKILTKKDAA
ncbi:50S ribosomal protein L32e [Candidatus Woesearchaeota archaeon]|nr:MAG: 50S ribosomal protein L32e [Candidatus Woesearchaeota archaeon]